MNLERLKQAEHNFLLKYPGGFSHPDMVAIGKKHNVTKLSEFVQEVFSKEVFHKTDTLMENWVKVISRSSMISMFEKPKFKSFVKTLASYEREGLAGGLWEVLYGDQKKGFELQLDIFKRDKLAKWSLMSAVPAYFNMETEIFIKPTTAKGVVNHFELRGLTYKPTPSWDFYSCYRDDILEMKTHVDPSLSPNNPAFCGFLMMSFPDKQV